jgi:hypothetical protein
VFKGLLLGEVNGANILWGTVARSFLQAREDSMVVPQRLHIDGMDFAGEDELKPPASPPGEHEAEPHAPRSGEQLDNSQDG